MRTVTIKGNERINGGEVVLRKPLAGVKNKAAIAAETAVFVDGKLRTIFKQSVYMTELLPSCIASHPWGTTPIRQALDLLDCDEYDLLVEELDNEINNIPQDVKKNLNQQSDLTEKEKTGLSPSEKQEVNT